MKEAVLIQVLADEPFQHRVQEAIAAAPQYQLCTTAVIPHPHLLILDFPHFGPAEQAQARWWQAQHPQALLIGRFHQPTQLSITQIVHTYFRGFLAKDPPPADILDALQLVWQGYTYLAPEITQQILHQLQQGLPGSTPSLHTAPHQPPLTNPEFTRQTQTTSPQPLVMKQGENRREGKSDGKSDGLRGQEG